MYLHVLQVLPEVIEERVPVASWYPADNRLAPQYCHVWWDRLTDTIFYLRRPSSHVSAHGCRVGPSELNISERRHTYRTMIIVAKPKEQYIARKKEWFSPKLNRYYNISHPNICSPQSYRHTWVYESRGHPPRLKLVSFLELRPPSWLPTLGTSFSLILQEFCFSKNFCTSRRGTEGTPSTLAWFCNSNRSHGLLDIAISGGYRINTVQNKFYIPVREVWNNQNTRDILASSSILSLVSSPPMGAGGPAVHRASSSRTFPKFFSLWSSPVAARYTAQSRRDPEHHLAGPRGTTWKWFLWLNLCISEGRDIFVIMILV